MEWTITQPVKVTEHNVEDIVVTAIEGGINYWCEGIQFAETRPAEESASTWAAMQLIKENAVKIRDEDGEHDLTITKLIDGLLKFSQKVRCFDVYEGEIDPSNFDAADADAVIQYALFCELKYSRH